jgi:hypothetical protein
METRRRALPAEGRYVLMVHASALGAERAEEDGSMKAVK